MNNLIPILQFLLVTAGSFVVFALLTSYLRFRKMQLQAEDHKNALLSPEEVVLLLLKELRDQKETAQLGLIHFEPQGLSDGTDFHQLIRQKIRKDDQLYAMENGAAIVAFFCPPENLPAVAQRLQPVFEDAEMPTGYMSMCIPEIDVQILLDWVTASHNSEQMVGWKIQPDSWPYSPPEIPMGISVDPLTGVLKPDRLPRALRRMAAIQRRSGLKLSVLCVDVDQLADYNDKYGRDFGDELLKEVGSILMSTCRESDLIGRWEEDCFVMAMVGESDDHVLAGERMSQMLMQTSIKQGEAHIRFSAGFGLATMPKDGRNPMLLLERAMVAMHEGKQRGRGLCVAYQKSFDAKVAKSSHSGNESETF